VNRIGSYKEVGTEAEVTIADCGQIRAGGQLDPVVTARWVGSWGAAGGQLGGSWGGRWIR